MNAMQPLDERNQLILRHLDGETSLDEQAAVVELLATDTDFGSRFRGYAFQVARLHELLEADRGGGFDPVGDGTDVQTEIHALASEERNAATAKLERRRNRSRRLTRMACASAVMVLIAVAAWWMATRPNRATTPEIADLHGTLHMQDNSAAAKGDVIWPGHRITTGSQSYARLQFLDGSTVDLSADTEVACLDRGSSKAIELVRGRIFLSVAPQAAESPFLINPGRADQVRVVGTKLQISRIATDETRVAVVSGEVEVGVNDRAVVLAEQTETSIAPNAAPAPPQPLDESELWYGLNRGLRATYFQNADLTGKSVTRIDANIDFDWDLAAPDDSLDGEHFSARWTGWLVPHVSDEYLFSAFVDDGMRLWIDERLVLDAWNIAGRRFRPADEPIRLEAGQRYAVKIEYRDVTHNAALQWRWQRPSTSEQIVPQSCLYPLK